MAYQDFITSGNLELYVHGLATPEEAREVEEMAATHPEVQQEINAIRDTLNQYILAHSVMPPEDLRASTLQRIDQSPSHKVRARHTPEKSHATTAALHSTKKKRPAGLIATASLLGLLFLGSAIAAYHFWQETEKAKVQTQTLQVQFDQFKKESQARQQKDAQLQEQFIAIRHWATRPIQLKGTKLSEEAFAVIYRNDVKRSTFLDLINLPEPPPDKQYQLWVFVNKQPVNLGVLELKTENQELLPVEFIENAQAFIITLEPKGGSTLPAPDQVYLTGAVGKS